MSGKSNGSSELPLQPPTSSLRCRTCSFVVTSLCRNDNYAPVETSRTKMCYEPPVTSANNQLLTDILNFLSVCTQQWGEWRFSPPYRRKSSRSHTRWFLVYLMLRLNQKTESLVVVFQTTFSCIWFCLLLLSEENTVILNMHLEICDLENNNWPLVSSQSWRISSSQVGMFFP